MQFTPETHDLVNVGFADKEVLSIEKEPQIIDNSSYGRQNPTLRKWIEPEPFHRHNHRTSASKIELHGSIQSLRFRETGEAQVLQKNRMLGNFGSQKA